MGGPGSGKSHQRWQPAKKTTVEECQVLDLRRLGREGRFVPGLGGWLTLVGGKRAIGLIDCTVRPAAAGLLLVLSYPWDGAGPGRASVEVAVPLQTTRPHLGGLRWWGRCPLTCDGIPCRRRVGKLYLPPGGRYFGCRHCHKLTYTSCQESHKHDLLYHLIAVSTGEPFAEVKRSIQRLTKWS